MTTPGGLTVAGVVVAELDDGLGMTADLSPRPHLHPVRTLGGRVVSQMRPDDHPHHAGVGVAVADVSGTNHWGGGTFRVGDGYRLRDDHGVQRAESTRPVDGGWRQLITWFACDGRPQADETRTITAAAHPQGWVLDWSSELVARDDLVIGSPATNGRPGAFYGGWLWRAPFRGARVRVADGEGEASAHGSRSPWLSASDGVSTLVAAQRGPVLPWFVRAEPDTYFGPALAVDRPRRVAAGEELVIRLAVLVADGIVSRDDAARFSGSVR